MKTLTTRDLNRRTASVLDAVEKGESFEVRRNGRAIGYLTRTAPAPERKPNWKAHFDWLRRQPIDNDDKVLQEFEDGRRRLAAREKDLENPPRYWRKRRSITTDFTDSTDKKRRNSHL